MKEDHIFEALACLLKETPGQSVLELANKLEVNRIFLAGYLKALEEQDYVNWRKVGPARLYYYKEGSHI